MRIRVTSDAFSDVEDSYAFYEKQEKGLGSYYRACIEQDLLSLSDQAGIHSKIKGYHHMNSAVFQSIFYYRIQAEEVVVVAILDGRIDPATRDDLLTDR